MIVQNLLERNMFANKIGIWIECNKRKFWDASLDKPDLSEQRRRSMRITIEKYFSKI